MAKEEDRAVAVSESRIHQIGTGKTITLKYEGGKVEVAITDTSQAETKHTVFSTSFGAFMSAVSVIEQANKVAF